MSSYRRTWSTAAPGAPETEGEPTRHEGANEDYHQPDQNAQERNSDEDSYAEWISWGSPSRSGWRTGSGWWTSSRGNGSCCEDPDEKDEVREHVPEWDGKTETLRVYRRRVDIYVADTKTGRKRR